MIVIRKTYLGLSYLIKTWVVAILQWTSPGNKIIFILLCLNGVCCFLNTFLLLLTKSLMKNLILAIFKQSITVGNWVSLSPFDLSKEYCIHLLIYLSKTVSRNVFIHWGVLFPGFCCAVSTSHNIGLKGKWIGFNILA